MRESRTWWIVTGLFIFVATSCGDGGTPPDGDGDGDADGDADADCACESDEDCDDGLFCNGEERCDPGRGDECGCVAGTPPCEDEGACDEEAELCAGECPDRDGDGHELAACGGDDCDDDDPDRYPSNVELCDDASHDEDCDPETFGERDEDGDGWLDAACCNLGDDGPNCGDDCDDDASEVNPSAVDSCDGIDNDCDGELDEAPGLLFYRDLDGDGYGVADETTRACSAPPGYAVNSGDCDDTLRAINPSAADRCNGEDDDCDGVPDPGCECTDGAEQDCGPPEPVRGQCRRGTQRCVAGAWAESCPGAVMPTDELCNSLDDDCDGEVDNGVTITCWADADDDGFAPLEATSGEFCPAPGRDAEGGCPVGWTDREPLDAASQDCSDDDRSRRPGVDERCNSLDDDCDGEIDNGVTINCWADADDDGYAALGASSDEFCPSPGRDAEGGCPVGWTDREPADESSRDCSDDERLRNPGVTERCNARDDDCDGVIDDGASAECEGDEATMSCLAGRCVVMACDFGYADCDRAPGNGCEVDLLNDPANCGGCDVRSLFGECDSGRSDADAALIDGGREHTCVRLEGGEVACWGRNLHGQLGVGSHDNSYFALLVDLDNVVDVSAGWYHSCAVRESGDVFCWGRNDTGELGDGTTEERTLPTEVDGVDDALSVCTASEHTCAVRETGEVLCWGSNEYGNLGDGTDDDSTSPVAVFGIDNAVAVTCGGDHTCAVLESGEVACWGRNTHGQLGDGTNEHRTSPVSVLGIETAEAIDAGDYHTCAVLESGELTCWGFNSFGQLGNGLMGASSNVPVEAALDEHVVDVGGGGTHTCAVAESGEAWCWGWNYYGQIGLGSADLEFIVALSPTPVLGLHDGVDLSAGLGHACAIREGGDVVCWGDARRGQLGTGGGAQENSPAGVASFGQLTQIAARTRATFGRHSSGTIWWWGSTPAQVEGVDDALHLYSEGGVTCVIRSTGDVMCWGNNSSGQLGDGTTDDRDAPTLVDLDDVVELGLGGGHTCARLSSGQVRCWGNNYYGQLGDGTTENRLTPVPVRGLDDAAAIAASGSTTCALHETGEIACWGNNQVGNLGDGSTTHRSEPAAVIGIDDAVGISVGSLHACALHVTGDVSCWGWNREGQLGDGTNTDRSAPVPVLGLHDAVEIEVSYEFSCVRHRSSSISCWGENVDGQLGDGTRIDRFAPVSLEHLGAVRSFTMGHGHICVQRPSLSVECWGDNYGGQLGDGTTDDSLTPVRVLGF